MIDIHTHLIPLVDDGSSSLETSLRMIQDEIAQGVTDIILTPHYCPKRNYNELAKNIKLSFEQFKKEVENRKLPVNLFLGQEIYISHNDNILDKLDNNELLTMNETNYVLVEFSMLNQPSEIEEIAYSFAVRGYKPIIAHIERYSWMTINLAKQLKQEGCLLQINSSSLLGKLGLRRKWFCKTALKNGLVDVVASDIHENRPADLNKAFNKIKKPELFYNLGSEILNKK